MTKLAILALVLAACGADELVPPTEIPPDAEISPPDADFSCRVLFLNFEGADLTMGTDDAPSNVSTIITGPQTAPAYRAADPDRDTKIAQIVTQVTDTLESVGVTVVSERPATGDYAMAIMGGESTDIGLPAGIGGDAPFAGCGNNTPNVVLYSFEAVNGISLTLNASANIAITSYLVSFGLPTSSAPQSCLCWDAPGCDDTVACTIGDSTTPRYDQATCGSGATIDAPAVIAEALACP